MSQRAADSTTDDLDAAVVSDAMQGAGVLPPEIRWVAGPVRLRGPARTVSVPGGDNLGLLEAIDLAAPGDVIVADCGGHPVGVWGEIATAAARRRGIAGLLLDGYVRDVEAVQAEGFTVFARGTAPTKATKDAPGRHGGQVRVGGTAIAPGDMVVGDRDGVVAVPVAEVPEMLSRAARIRRREKEVLEAVRAGQAIADLVGGSSGRAG